MIIYQWAEQLQKRNQYTSLSRLCSTASEALDAWDVILYKQLEYVNKFRIFLQNSVDSYFLIIRRQIGTKNELKGEQADVCNRASSERTLWISTKLLFFAYEVLRSGFLFFFFLLVFRGMPGVFPSKLFFSKNLSGSDSFDLNQARRLVGPDLGPDCLLCLKNASRRQNQMTFVVFGMYM